MYQQRYWKELDQLKIHSIYLGLYLEKTISIERSLNMFLAITSTSSIAGWVVWQDYSFVWGAIIAASHIVSAVKDKLPYKRRLKSLSGASSEFDALFITVEDRWFDVSQGRLTDEEIHKAHIIIKAKRQTILNKYFKIEPLPHVQRLHDKAIDQARTFITNFYQPERDESYE